MWEHNVPLVFATGYNRAVADRAEFPAVYLGKPFGREDLGKAILQAFDGAPARTGDADRAGGGAVDPLSDVIRYSRELRMVTQILRKRPDGEC